MNLNIAGIYLIKNTINGKVYIGQSLNIKNRWGQHKREAKYPRGKCRYLYLAMRKYGVSNFSITVIHVLDRDNNLFIDEDLNEFEKFYIKQYHSFVDAPICNGYNLTTGGDHAIKSLETRNKTSERNKGVIANEETRNKIRTSLKEYYQSAEAREHSRLTHLGNTNAKGKKRSKSQIQKWLTTVKPIYDATTHRYWELIKNYDMSVYGWVAKASRETGLTRVQIKWTYKKMGIPYDGKKLQKGKRNNHA